MTASECFLYIVIRFPKVSKMNFAPFALNKIFQFLRLKDFLAITQVFSIFHHFLMGLSSKPLTCSLENINIAVLENISSNIGCLCHYLFGRSPLRWNQVFLADYLMVLFLIFLYCSYSIIILRGVPVPLTANLQTPSLIYGTMFFGWMPCIFLQDENHILMVKSFIFNAITPQDTFPKFDIFVLACFSKH